jgi:hypothetical protein
VASSPGGQKQHPGATLERVAQPDHHVTLPLSGACACGQDLSELPATPLPERRQVTARVIRREVTEYRTVAGTCPGGRVHRSACPDAVRAPVPYGPGVSAVAVFLTQFPHRPYPRTADLLARVAGMALSLLNRASGGVVFTTIHKFMPEKGEAMPELSARQNIVVIADEAHRSQYGFGGKVNEKTGEMSYGFASNLRDALPNASFIGFTGTPIEKTDANTRAVFGDYISIYDIQRAVADKATVPIYYESRIAKLA